MGSTVPNNQAATECGNDYGQTCDPEDELSQSRWPEDRRPVLQTALAVVGAATFCLYSNSCRDVIHLIYDLPAGIAVFSFVAQLVIEGVEDGMRPSWIARVFLLSIMTGVAVGRQYGGWMISGHLTCVLAVALLQTADPRLHRIERIAYVMPPFIVLPFHWFLFDQTDYVDGIHHEPTVNALLVALVCATPVAILCRRWGK